MTAKARPVLPRLLAQVAVDPLTDCWTRTGYRNPNGYARISVEGACLYIHRVNTLRGDTITAFHARKTHCKHGHEFTAANTITEQGRYRRCRTCTEARRAA